MIKAVIFDLDGTLFDRDTSVKRLVEAQHDAFASSLAQVAKPVFVARFMELDARGYVPKDVVYQRLVEEFALRDVEAAELTAYFFGHYHYHCVPFPGLLELLVDLRGQGLLLGLITNGGAAHQQNTIRALGIESYFSVVLISGEEGIKKPDPAIFLRAVERFGVHAEECLFVGDHPVTDVAGARNAGLKGIWKRDDFWEPPTGADGVIDELHELAIHVAQGVLDLDQLEPELTAAAAELHFLDDTSLWQVARMHMTHTDAEQLETLHLKRQYEGLTVDEADEAHGLTGIYERIIVIRAEAAALLKERGYDVEVLQSESPHA